MGYGVSGSLFGSAARIAASILSNVLVTGEGAVEPVVDFSCLAGCFNGLAEDAFGFVAVNIGDLLNRDFMGLGEGAIVPQDAD